MVSTVALWRVAAVAAIFVGAHGGVLGQAAAPAAVQVSGAELQSWVDADGFAVGGVSLQNGCHFMGKSRGTDRYLSVFCSNQPAPWTVKGEAKVVGDQWCAKFTYPDGTGSDRCEEFFKIGENRYETRVGSVVVNRLYRLLP